MYRGLGVRAAGRLCLGMRETTGHISAGAVRDTSHALCQPRNITGQCRSMKLIIWVETLIIHSKRRPLAHKRKRGFHFGPALPAHPVARFAFCGGIRLLCKRCLREWCAVTNCTVCLGNNSVIVRLDTERACHPYCTVITG